MNEYTMIYPYNGILLNNKKELITDTHNNVGESQMHYAKWKQPVSEGNIIYDSTYLTFWKKQNYKDWKPVGGY